MPISRPRAYAGGLVLVGCLQYPAAELVTASAWRSPAYSFTQNYISDLGSLACGPLACSPLAWIMNAGFVASGILAIAAALLLAPLLASLIWRWIVVILAAVHGFGTVVVGLVPSAPHAAAGTPPLHFAAATAAILAGNLTLLALARALKAAAPVSLRATLAGLGVFGLGSALLLVTAPGLPIGLVERMAADTITPAEVILGVTLLAALVRARLTGRPIVIADLRRPRAKSAASSPA